MVVDNDIDPKELLGRIEGLTLVLELVFQEVLNTDVVPYKVRRRLINRLVEHASKTAYIREQSNVRHMHCYGLAKLFADTLSEYQDKQ